MGQLGAHESARLHPQKKTQINITILGPSLFAFLLFVDQTTILKNTNVPQMSQGRRLKVSVICFGSGSRDNASVSARKFYLRAKVAKVAKVAPEDLF